MRNYVIVMSPASAGREVDVVLQGPGIRPSGKQYIFATTARCEAFVEAVNFAYRQGLRDAAAGLRDGAGQGGSPLLVVTGHTPEDLAVRPERWWERLRRTLHL
jgi:hypothetical protein